MAAAVDKNWLIEINSIYLHFKTKRSWIVNDKCKVIVVVTTKNGSLVLK